MWLLYQSPDATFVLITNKQTNKQKKPEASLTSSRFHDNKTLCPKWIKIQSISNISAGFLVELNVPHVAALLSRCEMIMERAGGDNK